MSKPIPWMLLLLSFSCFLVKVAIADFSELSNLLNSFPPDMADFLNELES